MGCFLKALPNVKSAYVTCKEFTPNLQIFYTFLIFGFDVQVSGLKLPQWNTFIEFGLNVQVSGVILPHWNGPFSQSFTQRQKRVCYYQKIYPRPPKNLHRLICRICDISQLCQAHLILSKFVATDVYALFKKSVKNFCNIMFKTKGGGSKAFWTMLKKTADLVKGGTP